MLRAQPIQRFLLLLALFVAWPMQAQTLEQVEIDAPDYLDRGESLLVTITATGNCHSLHPQPVEPGLITFLALPFACNSPVGPWIVQPIIKDLMEGAYEIQVLNGSDEVLAADAITILDPDFSVEVSPALASPSDPLEITSRGIVGCVVKDDAIIDGSTITVGIRPFGICDPPPPLAVGEWIETVGPVVAGDYEVELTFGDELVARTELRVLETEQRPLLLMNGRFEVFVAWRTADGTTGYAVPVPILDDSGLFWFFSPQNIELTVKMIDACSSPSENFWFFAAGLTNVEVGLSVTDTESGVTKNYYNSPETEFEPILDTVGFSTCP